MVKPLLAPVALKHLLVPVTRLAAVTVPDEKKAQPKIFITFILRSVVNFSMYYLSLSFL